MQNEIDKLIAQLKLPGLTVNKPQAQNVFQIVGVVGLGETVTMLDVASDGPFDEITLPYSFSVENCAALIARGNSQYPRIKNGDIVIFHRNDASPSDMLGRESVIRLVDGRILLKTIRQGSAPDRFTLMSHNDDPIESVQIEWVGEVLSIVPAGAWHKVR